MTASDVVTAHLIVGPAAHGVVRHAIAVHAALAAGGDDHVVVRVDHVDRGLDAAALPEGVGVLHLHFTDRLFGRNPAAAARVITDLVAAARSRDIRTAVTLHDLPQPSDGSGFAARIDGYRAVLAAADAVVVSSDHESRLVTDHLDDRVPVTVIPLIVETVDVAVGAPSGEGPPTVGVLGFLYPGKGHIETLRAMDDLDPAVGFIALGAPSPGHDDLVDELHDHAAVAGRSVEVTGFLPDDELHRRMRAITVPVAFHRHMSASASVNTWRAVRRAPLVPRTRYTDELDRRSPSTLVVHDDDALAASITAALQDPDRTRIADGVEVHPTPAQVAAAYRDVARRIVA